MLMLLVTSHGSFESCGVKQGAGCSRGLRAINIPDAGGQRRYRPEEMGRETKEENKERK